MRCSRGRGHQKVKFVLNGFTSSSLQLAQLYEGQRGGCRGRMRPRVHVEFLLSIFCGRATWIEFGGSVMNALSKLWLRSGKMM